MRCRADSPARGFTDIDHSDPRIRQWVAECIRRIHAEEQRSADTHLIRFPLPKEWGIDLYLKDESTHVTGSLKHRLARSLFLYALCNGWIGPDTPVIEASSGSTAVSEAFFAKLLGLQFVAVIPDSTSPEKIALIEAQGGRCHMVANAAAVYEEARRLTARSRGHYMDQFTNAERATDWRGNNSIAESIFEQLKLEAHPTPEWIVAAAGTGGTSATLGRYIRYRGHPTRLCVPDPEGSAFFEAWRTAGADVTAPGSRIEGIGRPRVEPSFIPQVIDRMLTVPDDCSIAAMRMALPALGRKVGPSTGTNLWAALELVAEMRAAARQGSVVTILCDSGERYTDTYYDRDWIAARGFHPDDAQQRITDFLAGHSARP
jgi:cysteine synthase A